MIKELIEMQRELDKSFLEANGLESVPLENYYYAILDELGELNHELKANWCWWKKTQAPVDQDKVLEELVDVWHFVLSILGKSPTEISDSEDNLFDYSKEMLVYFSSENDFIELYQNILTCVEDIVSFNFPREFKNLFKNMILLTYKLNFTMEQVYDAYITKNKENYDRIKRGY